MEENNRRAALTALMAIPAGLAAASASARPAQPASGDLATRIDVLESRQRISDNLFAYARATDRLDEALLRSLFWPEATHKHGRFDGKSQDFIGFSTKIVGGLKYACHHVSNVSVEVKGNRAFSECYYFAQHRRAATETAGEQDIFFQGRYLDFHERRSGEWKIIRRRGLSDYTSPLVPAPTPFADWAAGHSERFPNDEYYKMQTEFRAG